MTDLRTIERDILAVGRVDGPELDLLRRHVYIEGRVSRPAADFLVELHKRVQHRTPAFEHFFYQAVKDHVLAAGRIDAAAAAWLRQLLLFRRDTLRDEERNLLRELHGEAAAVCPEFEALVAEAMKRPPAPDPAGP